MIIQATTCRPSPVRTEIVMSSSARSSPCFQVTPTVARPSTDCGADRTARSSVSGSPSAATSRAAAPEPVGAAAVLAPSARRPAPLTPRERYGGHDRADRTRRHQRGGVTGSGRGGRDVGRGLRVRRSGAVRTGRGHDVQGHDVQRPGPRSRRPRRPPGSAGTGARNGFCSRHLRALLWGRHSHEYQMSQQSQGPASGSPELQTCNS